ncbi:MAG: DUF454 family protein [Bacteroidales bacterium]
MKATLVILGTISLSLGVLGIIVPGLPTTPFLYYSFFSQTYCGGVRANRNTDNGFNSTNNRRFRKQ